jgi:formylglycine-generating enzyme required for sulfatase activity
VLSLQATIQDPEMAREMIQAIDSLGASAAVLSLGSIHRICLRLEDYFFALNESPVRVDVDRELELLFLNAFDGLHALVEELQGPMGLGEEKAQEVMADVKPVFERLATHLNELVAASTMAPVTAPASSRPASQARTPPAVFTSIETRLLMRVFSSDVPIHLHEMLTLFKQADIPETRQQLQDICQTLKFDPLEVPTGWKKLVSAAQWAIAYQENTFRQLAPVIIKTLKQAQKLGAAGRWDEIKANEALDALQPPVILWREPKRAQCFTDSEIGVKLGIQLDLMLIPGGTFTMGSSPDELGRFDPEGPQHEVTVSTFLMGRYPVTQAQWRKIAGRTDLKVKDNLEPYLSNSNRDDFPVERVSWYDAVEFCARLSKLTGHTYRLPTEAEWEYACRAGTTAPFHFGGIITTDLANYRGEDNEYEPKEYPGNYSNGPKGIYREATTAVHHFNPLANAFGLCDMHGNVWEWCLDHWHSNYEGAPTDGSAWLTANERAGRLRRGGSWKEYPWYCRSACRFSYNPIDRSNSLGFRVVCEARGL